MDETLNKILEFNRPACYHCNTELPKESVKECWEYYEFLGYYYLREFEEFQQPFPMNNINRLKHYSLKTWKNNMKPVLDEIRKEQED